MQINRIFVLILAWGLGVLTLSVVPPLHGSARISHKDRIDYIHQMAADNIRLLKENNTKLRQNCQYNDKDIIKENR